MIQFASRSVNKIDDILVRELHPYRMSWLAPLVFIYLMAGFFPDYKSYMEKATLFLILWLSVVTLNGFLNAVNAIYEIL